MRPLPARLAITVLLPLLLVVTGDLVLLPGMADLLDGMARPGGAFFGVDRTNVSVLGLGLAPILAAYGVVELAAFLVPRWSRFRHGNPEGRVKLERAARVVAIAIATVQAGALASSLAAFEREPRMFGSDAEPASTPVLMVTLVGGMCAQIVVAEIISRQAIANGYVLITVVSALASLRESLFGGIREAMYLGALEARHFVPLLLGVALPAVATWLALRGGGGAHAITSAEDGAAGPYRAARALVVSPWVPVPSSSLAPYAIAVSLMGLPLALSTATQVPGQASDLGERLMLMRPLPFTLVLAVLTGGLAVAFAKLLHRPREMAELARQAGFAGGEDLASRARAAVDANLLPTLLLFATLILASGIAGAGPVRSSLLFVPLLVALVMDVAGSLRARSLVGIWQERRASAVPVVRAVLAAEGIEATARGMGVLSLLQVFAPYAPAEIMVSEADAPRATSILRHVFLGEPRLESEPRAAASAAPVTPSAVASWTPARRVMALAGISALALVTVVALHGRRAPSTATAIEPARRLEIVRVDDDFDLAGAVADVAVPHGIELRSELGHVGVGRREEVGFAVAQMAEGETYDAAEQRMRRWTDSLHLPPGSRIGLEAVVGNDADNGKSKPTAVRTLVLKGEPIITNEDVVEAVPSMNEASGFPDVYVAVTLSPEGAERFRLATRDHIERRIAILVDGRVESAPVVRSEIGGGRLSITLGGNDPERRLTDAKALARGLGAASP